jgi:hypothetical protein
MIVDDSKSMSIVNKEEDGEKGRRIGGILP